MRLYLLIILFFVPGSLVFGQHRKVSTAARRTIKRTTTAPSRKSLTRRPVSSGRKGKLMVPKPVPFRTVPARMADPPPVTVRLANRYTIGVRAGLTYPIYSGTMEGVTPMIGFTNGITLAVGTGRLIFQGELNYARYATRNGSARGNQLIGASDVVKIPFLLNISSGTIHGNRFFANIGPYIAYITSTSLNGKKTSLEGTGADRFSSGLAAGAGLSLATGPGHLTAEIRGYWPFGSNNQPFTGTLLTIPVQAAIGYTFPLGHR